MWIRTQDKEGLINCNDVRTAVDPEGNECLAELSNGNYGTTLGVYKSHERCIEILDEIQQIIKHPMYQKSEIGITFIPDVYQMPKK